MTIIALFLMWSPSDVLHRRVLRAFAVLLGVCGMLHFVVFWHKDQPFVLSTVLTGLASAFVLVVAAGGLFFLLRHRPFQRSLAETRQSLEATQEQLSLEQHLLAALVDNMPDAIYFKDRESRFIRCNQSTAELFQVRSPDEVVGRCDHDFFPKDEADVYRADELFIMQSGEPIINKEEHEHWPDGHDHWVLSTKMPLRDTSQNIIGTFGLSRDITNLKLAESRLAAKVTELESLHTELQHSNQELEQFAYVASHDLQEPLRTVVGFCQLLEMEYQNVLDDNGRMYLTTIVEGGKRMQRLISDLLEYSRISRRGDSFQLFPLRRAVDEGLALLQSAIQESGAIIHIGELPDVLADEGQMIRLFQNLVGNAIKYRQDNVPEVNIRSVETADSWKVYISDNGIGIPQEFSEQVFIIFKRLHTRTEYPGTGIGLAVCRRIVERHGGRLRLIYHDDPQHPDHSMQTPPQGSTLEMTLPKQPPLRTESSDR
ncbi:MAG: PAS domain-containing protein [Planctomycetaceae bacterium]